MENRDNVTFDINGHDWEYFQAVMKLAIGLGPNDKVKAYFVDKERNRIVLLWHPQQGSSEFIVPLSAEEVAIQVWAWLKTTTPTEDAWDHDGHSEQGWRFYVDSIWGAVEPFGEYAIVAIEPVWIEYGK